LVYLQNSSEWALDLRPFAFEYGNIGSAKAQGLVYVPSLDNLILSNPAPQDKQTAARLWQPSMRC